jgi:uncharacterized protein
MRSRLFALGLLLLVAAASPARATTPRRPSFSGYVVDSAHIIDPGAAAQITAIASRLDRQGLAQLAVCTLPSLDGESKEEAAADIFKQWQLGHGKEKSDGVLILLVPGPPGQRKIKVETGTGMEGLLNDGKVGALLDQVAVPRLLRNEYGPAAAALAAALADVIDGAAMAGDSAVAPWDGMRGAIGAGMDSPRELNSGVAPFALAICAMGALLMLLLSSPARRRFPGAGTAVVASALVGSAAVGLCLLHAGVASWFAFLLGAGVNGLAFASMQNRKCPKCRGWVVSSETVEKRPSNRREGSLLVEERCARCDYAKTTHRPIPRKAQRRSSASGGGGWGGGGGDSGGGGGDSGGGFSGGGGGDSGGGGAGREV